MSILYDFEKNKKQLGEKRNNLERIIVAGSRTITDYELIKKELNKYIGTRKNVVIVSGKARGVDQLGERYAKEKGFICEIFPAEWGKHGKSAGYIRNKEMAKVADTLFAFWDGKSKGTGHMIQLAKEYNLNVFVIEV